MMILKEIPGAKSNHALKAMIAAAREWHIEYNGYFSNHLSHNYVALGCTGRSEDALVHWRDIYTKNTKLEPALPATGAISGVPVTEDNFTDFLGNDTKRLYPEFLQFFDSMIAERGIEDSVRRCAPPLLAGMLGAALHPAIHLGFALEVDSETMVAEGLAYLASAFSPVIGHHIGKVIWTPGSRGLVSVAVDYSTLHKNKDFYSVISEAVVSEKYINMPIGMFQKKTRTFCDPELSLGSYMEACGPVELPDVGESLTATIEEATVLAAAYLLGSRNEFFVIHALTSLHATIVTMSNLDPISQRNALAHWFRSTLLVLSCLDFVGSDAASAYIARWTSGETDGIDCSIEKSRGSEQWWQYTLHKAQTSSEEHISKAVFVLWRFFNSDSFSAAAKSIFAEAAREISKDNISGRIEDNIRFF